MASNTKNGVHKDADFNGGTDSLRSLLGGSDGGVGQTRKLVEPLRELTPLVADFLGGVPAEKGQPEIPGGTITFSIRDGKIRFSVNVKTAEKTFFGDVADVLKPWESIESAFLTGAVSSKRYSEQKATMTEDQKASIVY